MRIVLAGGSGSPGRRLAAAATARGAPPRVWLQLSTTAIYGDVGDVVLDEDGS